MNIYNKDGSLLLSVPVTSNAKYVRELAGDCYILLSWYAPYGTPLDAGTYIEHNGAKYALLDTYTPRMNTEASWLYEPQFKPQEMAWSKIPFFFYNGDSRESDWTLTSDAPDFLECVLKAIKNETGEEYTFSTDVTGTITLQFSSTDILSGLNQIADGFKTEWWVKDKVIHLSRCIDDTKTEITLSIGENVGIPSVSEKSEGYYNRFYVFGSTRNIVQGYSGANVNNLTNKRLTLDPVKYPNGYYQLTDGTFSKVLIYEDIYPAATNIEIVSLMSRTDYVLDDNGKKIQIGTDSEGNPIWDMFTVWYMKIAYKNPDGTYTDFEFNDWNYTDDPNVHAGKEGMLIPGLKVSVSFASGPLMGREFELAYIKSDTTIKTSSGSIIVPKGYFEILYTKENDYIIPDSAYLVPVEGNNVVLFNIKMPDIYIQDAYDRLEAAMKKDIEEKYLSDLNQYTFETYPGAFGSIDIGAPVAFGTLKTRVVSVSYNLETPSVFEITIGNELQKGTIQQLVDDTLTANKNIEIIAALNKTTEAIANAYTRTYQEILKQFDLISSIFELDTTSVAGKTLIHAKYDGLYSDGDIAAGGAWAGTPSGGGKTYLNELLDVQLATSSLNVGDMLMWNGDKYVNIPQSSITPDLSAYATQQWVLDKKYLTSVPVASVVGQTGNITTAQVATALTDAGYKLTDTTYGLATTTSNGLMSATDKTKLNGIAENANNYTLPTASSETKGGIKVGTTLSISGEVLNLKSGFPSGTYTKVQIDDYGRVSSGSTLSASDIPSLPWSKITTGKPTTISGYGITDAYTKTETDNKVAELQSLLDSMFERVYDSNNKLIRIHSNVTISSSGDLVAGGNSEGGGTSGGTYTQLEWNAIKALNQSESGLLASAYSVKEAYNELSTAIETLAGKATNVTFAQTLTSGTKIGAITVDGTTTNLYAPTPPTNVSQLTNDSGYITGITKAMVEGVLTGNITSHTHSYLPLSGGTITSEAVAPLALKSTSSSGHSILQFISGETYLGALGFKGLNDPYFRTAEGTFNTLIHSGNIRSQVVKGLSMNYVNNLDNATIGELFSSDFKATNIPSTNFATGLTIYNNQLKYNYQLAFNTYAEVFVRYKDSSAWQSWKQIAFTDSNVASATNADTIDGYHADSFTKKLYLGTTDLNSIGDSLLGQQSGNANATTELHYPVEEAGGLISILSTYNSTNQIYGTYRTNRWFARGAGTDLSSRTSWREFAFLDSNVASASKWETPRTITLTGSVTGSVSIDGSQNVSLATTTNHTHTFASLNDKPTTISGYGIMDAYTKTETNTKLSGYLPLTGGTLTGNISVASSSDTPLKLCGSANATRIALYDNANNFKAYIMYGWGSTFFTNQGSVNTQLGLTSGIPYYSPDNGGTKYTLLHSGNYNSYAPTLTGTGASGTWGISISGDAATSTKSEYSRNLLGRNTSGSDYPAGSGNLVFSEWNTMNDNRWYLKADGYECRVAYATSATKLATSRTIWGQSFDGTGNVSGALTGVTTITTSGQICINTSSSQSNNFNEGIRCNLGGSDNWASVVLGGASGSTNGAGSGVYSLTVKSSLFRIKQNNTEVLCINTSNNVGIGTTSPSYKLHIVGTAYASENIIASGDLTAGSDIRYKDKIQDLRLSIHDIALAPAFTYKWNNREDALVHIGSSAQYWLNTDAKDAVYYDKQNDFYHLNYASLALCNTIILARGMETQEEKIARLEARIKELEDKLRQYGNNR